MDSKNPYTQMQYNYYEGTHDLMNQENHRFHDENPDYYGILMKPCETGFEDKVGLDFGCGCGRNMQNIWNRFKRIDGVDLSPGNIQHARENLINDGVPTDRFNLYTCDGVSLSDLKSDEYDFVVHTIVFQHICVHNIRLGYLKEFFRVMKSGGVLSFQMGVADYFEDKLDAGGTNGFGDVRVSDPEQLLGDLREVGFVDLEYDIQPSWRDTWRQWIFVRARKP
jgi:SAM-dependent methyltransferase